MAQITTTSGPFAFLERQLESLSSRDRALLVGLYLSFLVGFLAVLWFGLYSVLETQASDVRDLKKKISAMHDMKVEYDVSAQHLAGQESRLRGYASQPVTAFVEELASKHGLTDFRVDKKGSEQVGSFVQSKYLVEVKKAEQQALYRFLYDVEVSGYPARVTSATFKSQTVRKEIMHRLDLELEVLEMAEIQ